MSPVGSLEDNLGKLTNAERTTTRRTHIIILDPGRSLGQIEHAYRRNNWDRKRQHVNDPNPIEGNHILGNPH